LVFFSFVCSPFLISFLASFSFILGSCFISSQFSSFSPSYVLYFLLYHAVLALFSFFVSVFVIVLFFQFFRCLILFSATSLIREGW
jgi:hypothetical protein